MRKNISLVCLLALCAGCSPSWQSSNIVSNTSTSQKQQLVNASASSDTSSVNPNSGTIIGASSRSASSIRDEVFIIVYREKGFVGSATAWPVNYNGVKIGSLKNGSFIAIKTNAGNKHLQPVNNTGILAGKVVPTDLNSRPGQTYYLRHGTHSITDNVLRLIPTDATTAKSKIADYKMVKVIDEYKAGNQGARGEIAFIKGRAVIERGIKTLPAKRGSPLFAGDKINVEEASQVSIDLFGSGIIKITEKTSFLIPDANHTKPAPPSIAGTMWNKMKVFLKGESFEVKNPTAVAGVRG